MLAAVAALLAALSASAEAPTLYGVKTYCEQGCSSGVYTLKAEKDAQPEVYWRDGDMMGNGGAVYDGNHLYVLSYLDFFGELYWTYQTCDVETKTYSYKFLQDMSFSDVGSAMTYDPSNGNVYSVCIDPDDVTKFTLSTMDTITARKTVVAPIERMCAMASTADGRLYGIDMDGNLKTIDKYTGATELVGSTGVKPYVNQSAVIEYATETMYWCAYTEEGGFLYSVDIHTAEATLLSELNDKMQLVGLFILQSADVAGTPESATSLTADFAKGSLTGSLTFTLPTTDTDGKTLTSAIDWAVTCGGTTLADGTAEPGADVKADVTLPAAGNCQLFVTTSNAAGNGRPASISFWAGNDTPCSVTDLTLTVDGADATLTWNISDKGINGGYVDTDNVVYEIIRGPHEQKITDTHRSTTFTETIDTEGVNPLMYAVIPSFDGRKGEIAVSQNVNTGEYWRVPFVEDLSDIFRQLVFTIDDSNYDKCTWQYGEEFGAMYCMWPLEPTSDDWLISPAVWLEEGKTYQAFYNVRSEGKWNYDRQEYEGVYCGTLSCHLGDTPAPEAMTRQLGKPCEPFEITWQEMTSEPFEAERTGIHYFGLHHTGPCSIYYALVNRMGVNEVDPTTAIPTVTAAPAVSVDGHTLRVAAQAGGIRVVTPEGRTVAATSAATLETELESGIYIVVTPTATVKTAVR